MVNVEKRPRKSKGSPYPVTGKSQFSRPAPMRVIAKSKIKKLLLNRNEFNIIRLEEYMDKTYTLSWREWSEFPGMLLNTENYATDKAIAKLEIKLRDTLYDLMLEFPEFKAIEDEKKRKFVIYNDFINNFDDDDKLKPLFIRLCDEHNLSSYQIEKISIDELETNSKTSGDEYISIHMHTSTWTYYIESYVIIDNKKYKSKCVYDTETNRV